MDWTQSGYPAKHKEIVQRDKRVALAVFMGTGLFLATALVATVYFAVHPAVAALSAAIFILFGLLGSLMNVVDTIRYVRVMPYYERELGGIDTFLTGYALAKYLNQLDTLAIEHGVRTISSFGFADDLRGETLVWHDGAAGIACVRALLAAIDEQAMPADVREAIRRDLRAWEHALNEACTQGVRFCVLMIHGNATSGHEWDIRQGSAF